MLSGYKLSLDFLKRASDDQVLERPEARYPGISSQALKSLVFGIHPAEFAKMGLFSLSAQHLKSENQAHIIK